MAQAHSGRGNVARFSLRTIALIVGLVGAAVTLIINLLNTTFHVLGKVAGISNDPAHFLYGLVCVLGGIFGSLLAPLSPIIAAILLIASGIGFFFIVGPWALVASPFFFVAATLTFSNRHVSLPSAE